VPGRIWLFLSRCHALSRFVNRYHECHSCPFIRLSFFFMFHHTWSHNSDGWSRFNLVQCQLLFGCSFTLLCIVTRSHALPRIVCYDEWSLLDVGCHISQNLFIHLHMWSPVLRYDKLGWFRLGCVSLGCVRLGYRVRWWSLIAASSTFQLTIQGNITLVILSVGSRNLEFEQLVCDMMSVQNFVNFCPAFL
jgi:hypothetical protein